ncbi:hypothetical protein OZX68_03310 [Streptococcaceae bacterium ESL0729]|nr:hypothetical protein OZX68_03310 [Streptococcaceae bacterium ESL0729]
MADYTEKQEKVLEKISHVLTKLDETVDKYSELEESGKSHRIREWIEEKKAIHEIKKILKEVDKYSDNADREYDKELAQVQEYVESIEDQIG